MYPDGEVDRLYCGNCKHFGFDSPGHTPCRKRIDHVTVRFAVPWFKGYDCRQFTGIVCSEFEPSGLYRFLAQTWRGFDYYWPRFVEQWGAPGYMAFILNGNTAVRYRVRAEDFVFGNMFVDGKLNAYERTYYIRTQASPTGYQLVTEPWDPTAEVTQTPGERIRAEILRRGKEIALA